MDTSLNGISTGLGTTFLLLLSAAHADMPRPSHFEIHASNPATLIEFYGALFQWSFNKWNGPVDYWMVATGPDSEPGANGGLVQRRGPSPNLGKEATPVISFVSIITGKEDAEALVRRAQGLGGTVAVPLQTVEGVGRLVYLKDPDGNIFGYLQGAASPDG